MVFRQPELVRNSKVERRTMVDKNKQEKLRDAIIHLMDKNKVFTDGTNLVGVKRDIQTGQERQILLGTFVLIDSNHPEFVPDGKNDENIFFGTPNGHPVFKAGELFSKAKEKNIEHFVKDLEDFIRLSGGNTVGTHKNNNTTK